MGYQKKGAYLWIANPTPATVGSLQPLLSASLQLDHLKRSSFLPTQKGWTQGLRNSDFYFCELQNEDAAQYTLKGDFVNQGEVINTMRILPGKCQVFVGGSSTDAANHVVEINI